MLIIKECHCFLLFYVHFQERLVFHSFVNVVRRHEILGGEKRDIISHGMPHNVSIRVTEPGFSAPCAIGANGQAHADSAHAVDCTVGEGP